MKLAERRPRPLAARSTEVLRVEPTPSEIFRLEDYFDADTLKLVLESLDDSDPEFLVKNYFTCLLLGDEVLSRLPLKEAWDSFDNALWTTQGTMDDWRQSTKRWVNIASYARYLYWDKKPILAKLTEWTLDPNNTGSADKTAISLLHPEITQKFGINEDSARWLINKVKTATGVPTVVYESDQFAAISLLFPHFRPELQTLVPKLKKMALESSQDLKGEDRPNFRKVNGRLLLKLTASIRVCLADSVKIDGQGKLLVEFEKGSVEPAQPLPVRPTFA